MVTDWIPIVSVITSSIMVVIIVALVTKSRERRVESQMQMQSKLIERFNTSADLAHFLQSPAGRQFVTGVQAAPKVFTRERIVSAFTRAIILTALGSGFVVLALLDDDSGWYIPAAIVFSLGLGYLFAAIVTWRFSMSMRLDDDLPPIVGSSVGNSANNA